MKKYLISLEKDVKRRELFFSQPNTDDFEIFNAINTMQETEETLSALFDIENFSRHYARKITKGEVGCTLSHLQVYEKIVTNEMIRENEFVLICEDDALFAENFQVNLDSIIRQNIPADIVLLGQSKLPKFDHFELDINYPTTFSFLEKKIEGTSYKYSYPYRNYFAGTVAYLIKKSTVRNILSKVKENKKPFWLADDYNLFGHVFKINIMIIRPLLVIENPVLISNLEDFRGTLKNNMCKKVIKYPLKKLFALVRNL